MGDADLAMDLKSTSSLIEQFSKKLTELESQENGSSVTVSFTEIVAHFRDLEAKLVNRYNELEAREKAFKQEESEGRLLLAAREAEVASKEIDMYERIQVLKDTAVTAIVEAQTNHLPPSVEDTLDALENMVSRSHGETNTSLTGPTKGDTSVKTADEVTFRQELIIFCEQMNTKGLLDFIMENRKHITVLCEELSHALERSSEPGRLVLDSLEGFYPPDEKNISKKDTAALHGKRHSCINLMEAMNAMLARADAGSDHLLSSELKQQAKAIADEWRSKLADGNIVDAAKGRSLEAEAFLQLLVTFRIASEFEEDELCKAVLAVCERRQAPELCRSLGLAHKMPGVIEELISKGKSISAVHFVHAFELVELFPTVPLLKTYLKDVRRNSQGKRGNSRNSESVQNDVNAKELAALRAVINCVQQYDLEADYPLDSLKKRVVQLERLENDDRKRFREPTGSKSDDRKRFREPTGLKSDDRKRFREPSGLKNDDRKRFREPSASKPPHNKKKQRSNAGGSNRHLSPATAYMAVNGRQRPYGASSSDSYPRVNPYSYPPPQAYPHPPSQTMYSQQVYEQDPYYYPPNSRAAPPPAYGDYTSGVPSSYQPYM